MMKRKSAIHITSIVVGVYAGLLGILHGIFELVQGSVQVDAVLIQAIGWPCQPETVWHACLPAMTIFPNLRVSGILAVIAGLFTVIWAIAFLQRKRGGLGLLALSVVMLLTGGGFVPVFSGGIAAAAAGSFAVRLDWFNKWSKQLRFLAAFWPGPLVIMALWFPGSWLLGHFFPQAMLAVSGFSFLILDLGLPVFLVFSSFAYDLTNN